MPSWITLHITMSDKKYDVIALGSCTMDMIFDVDDIMRMDMVDRNQKEKKYVCVENSSKLNVKSVKFYPGGSAANIACDLSNIGLDTAYIGGVGNDSNGDAAKKDMEKHGVDLSGLKTFDSDATATSVILVNSFYKDRSILAYKGANDLFSAQDVVEEMLKNARCFAWTSLTSDNSIGAIKKCIDIAKKTGALIAAAPSISIIKNRAEDAIELVKNSKIISLNDEELEAITGESDVKQGMKILLDWGLVLVNCTLGKEGQWITDGEDIIKTRPPTIHVKDTTGAGDATMSGIIYGKMKNMELQKIAKIAASLSAMEIEATGVRVGLPEEFSELEGFMNSHTFEQRIEKF